MMIVLFAFLNFSPEATVIQDSEIYRLWIFVTTFFLWCSSSYFSNSTLVMFRDMVLVHGQEVQYENILDLADRKLVSYFNYILPSSVPSILAEA